MEVDEQMEDLPEDEGMDDLDLGLEEALQGTFTTQSTITADEKVEEGRDLFLLLCLLYLLLCVFTIRLEN